MSKYLVIIESAEGQNYSAYAPDLPGCVAAGSTEEETLELMREAIKFHLEMLREAGEPVPAPAAVDTVMVEVA